MKYNGNSIACDSSALISLADTCFLDALAELRKSTGNHFVMSESVKFECVDNPLRTKSHTLPAIRIKLAINEGLLTVADSSQLKRATDDMLWIANNIFYCDDRPMSILHRGEAETLALAAEVGLGSVLIDERTTRMLVEDPATLGRHLQEEIGKHIRTNGKYLERFQQLTGNMQLFRSCELMIIAYEKGYFKKFNGLEKQAIEAALYGLKFAGCSVGFGEIEEFTRSIA